MRSLAHASVLALALLLGIQRLAEGHTALLRSSPASGAHLATSPARISFVFSEPLEFELAHVSLVPASGTAMALVVARDPHDVNAMVASVPEPVGEGTYRVSWHVVSADGHPVQGSFMFSVGTATAASPPVADTTASDVATWGPTVAGAPLVPAFLRGTALTALMALTGMLYFMTGVSDEARRRPLRAVHWLALATVALLIAHLIAWALNATPDHVLSEAALRAALASESGRIELWRAGLALLTLWAIALARRPGLALVFATGALAISGLAGHPAAIHPVWAVPAKSLHLLAGAAWLGGLLWLLAMRRIEATAFARQAERVSGTALVAIVVVAISGAVQALLFMPSPLDLVRTAYGALVLAKVTGLVVLAGFGAHHRYRVMPHMATAAGSVARFASSLRWELAVMIVTILLGGTLAYVSPDAHPAIGAGTAGLSHPSAR